MITEHISMNIIDEHNNLDMITENLNINMNRITEHDNVKMTTEYINCDRTT